MEPEERDDTPAISYNPDSFLPPAWADPMPEEAHVIALLGKSHAKQSSEISREFARRLDAYVNIISRVPRANLYVAICGFREAVPAMAWLLREHAQLLPSPGRRFEDDVSRTSIENFEALARYLTSTFLPQHQPVRLTIVSSDYHVARLRFVDEHLPPQSLVRSVASAVDPKSVGWESVPYSPPPGAADPIQWCSRLYTLAEMLMPLQINVEGILESRLTNIVGAAYSRFRSSLSAIEELLDSPPEQIRTEFRPTLETADQAVRSLVTVADRLASPLVATGRPTQELEDMLAVLRGALRRLRTATDLDGPEFDRLYSAD
jgi:hypothetical protein